IRSVTLYMIFNSLTPRNQTEYPRYQVSDAQKIAGSNRGRFKAVGGFCPVLLSYRLALLQSCSTTLRRMFIRTAAAAGAWRCLAFWLAFALLAMAPWAASAADDVKPDPMSIELFEKEVRPLLAKHCMSRHGPTQQFPSLRIDSRQALLKGGSRGPAIVPGDASLSLLAKAVRHEGLKMPVGGKLAAEEIAAIEKWINLGAPW